MRECDKNAFKNRLNEALMQRQMKAIDLCNKAGLKRSAVSQYLSGRIFPTAYKLLVIAHVLNVSPYWLVGMDVIFTERSDSDEWNWN